MAEENADQAATMVAAQDAPAPIPPTYALAGPGGVGLYARLFAGYLGQYVRGRLEYRGDVLAGAFAELLQQAVTLTFLGVIFTRVPSLRGWSRPEVYFVYAVFQLSWAVAEAFSGSVWGFGERYIVRGELDRILLRPAPPIFQLLLEGVAVEPVSQVAAGLAILVWAAGADALHWAWWMPPLLAASVVAGGTVYVAVFFSLACIAFWVDGRTGIAPLVFNLTTYAQYPVTIYGHWLRWLLTFLLPFAFAAFYPAAALLRPGQYLLWGLASLPVAAVTVGVAAVVWAQGLRRYQGAGS